VCSSDLNSRIIYGIEDGRFFWSAVDDADDISALDFATAEGDPDELVGIRAHLQELRVFGASSMEVWADTGDATAPFRRNRGAVVPIGCIGVNTIASLDNDLIWVDDAGVVRGGSGYQGNRISHFGVEESIRATSDKSTIEALAYHYLGHAFYVLSGPDWTWKYNRTTGRWFQKYSYGESRWRGSKVEEFAGKIIVGDSEVGNLYEISRTTYDEAGSPLVFKVRSAPMHAFPSRICVDRLYADFVTGVGINSTSTHLSDPQVGLRYSDDGGRTWSNQRLKSLGAIGKYSTRVVWDGLGVTGRTGRIWELEASSAVVRGLMYAAVEGDPIGT